MIIFDILLLLVTLGGVHYGYKHGNLSKVYEIVKIIIGIAISSKYGLTFGIWLTKAHVLKAETFGVLILIGFLLVLGLYWLVMFILELAYKEFLESYLAKQSKYVAAVFSGAEFFIIFTLGLFVVLQFYWPRIYLKSALFKSVTYKPIHYFYKGFLNDKLINNTLYEGTGAGFKETIMNTAAESVLD